MSDDSSLAMLSSVAAALLATFFAKTGEGFAKSAGETGWKSCLTLLRLVRSKFRRSPEGDASIENLRKSPADVAARNALQTDLLRHMQGDAAFRALVADLVRQTPAAKPDALFSTTIHGDVAKFVQIGTAGDVTL